jgi:hypothetical protein
MSAMLSLKLRIVEAPNGLICWKLSFHERAVLSQVDEEYIPMVEFLDSIRAERMQDPN